MIKILLASHGNLAAGMLSSLELIMGKQENVEVMCAYMDGEDDISPRVQAFVDGMKEEDTWIVFTDLLGGSVNNEFVRRQDRRKFRLIAGMNLALVITAVGATISSDDPEEIMSELKELENCGVYFSEDKIAEETEDDEF